MFQKYKEKSKFLLRPTKIIKRRKFLLIPTCNSFLSKKICNEQLFSWSLVFQMEQCQFWNQNNESVTVANAVFVEAQFNNFVSSLCFCTTLILVQDLWTEENCDIEHKNEKEKLKEYLRRLRLALDTEFSANSKILAVPGLRYSFGIINWHEEEVQNLDRKTRKQQSTHGQHHPKADIDYLYVPRKQGGRRLKQLKEA